MSLPNRWNLGFVGRISTFLRPEAEPFVVQSFYLAVRLSVIIPTLNEVKRIGPLLDHLHTLFLPAFGPAFPAAESPCGLPSAFTCVSHKQNQGQTLLQPRASSGDWTLEVIVVDGGSTDGTAALVAARAHTRPWLGLLTSLPGRAIQLNAGAAVAQGHYLYFLHADCLPPPQLPVLLEAAQAQGLGAACCRLRFDQGGPLLAFLGWCTRWNYNALRYGDQSLLVERGLFAKAGGYREDFLIMEDNELVCRLGRLTAFKVLDAEVLTSARKYLANGVLYLQLIYILLYFCSSLGIAQPRLRQWHDRWVKPAS
ncbi:MAG: glycosyltransferase [Lewinella sp.]|nr:glycosyltransferase [Lewinella sp.]